MHEIPAIGFDLLDKVGAVHVCNYTQYTRIHNDVLILPALIHVSATAAVPQSVFDALTSHAHNFGWPKTCGSESVAAVNAGELGRGCDLLAYAPDGSSNWSCVGTRFIQGHHKYRQGVAGTKAEVIPLNSAKNKFDSCRARHRFRFCGSTPLTGTILALFSVPSSLFKGASMTRDNDKGKDILRESYEKETSAREHAKNKKKVTKDRRSLMGAPVDPNSPTTDLNFPPGLDPEDAKDPGRSTPGAPPVDNRSGQKK